jgi:exodeoxyribonuclease VII small subunit
MANKDTPIDFEKALAELEALVTRMETGELTLEASLEAFERGVKLTRECQSALAAAELRVKTLTGSGDAAELSDLPDTALTGDDD